MAFAAFDLLELDGHHVLAEPWAARRKRLEDLLELPPPGVCLVPVTDDAPALWHAWVGMGGEGIVLKERTATYRPGIRSPAWLKLKPKLTLDVVVTGGSAERVRWGRRCCSRSATRTRAPAPSSRSARPCPGRGISLRPHDRRARVALVCWGMMPSGMLRHL